MDLHARGCEVGGVVVTEDVPADRAGRFLFSGTNRIDH
jgi:hypothetical protein